jgi:hypothetical protein
LVGPAPHRRFGGNDGDVAAGRGSAGRLGARLDDTDDRQGADPGAHRVQAHRGGGVAGHDQAFHAVPRQRLRCLHRIARHGLRALGAIGQPCRVAEVHEALVRQGPHQRGEHREAADPGIEHTNGRVQSGFRAQLREERSRRGSRVNR